MKLTALFILIALALGATRAFAAPEVHYYDMYSQQPLTKDCSAFVKNGIVDWAACQKDADDSVTLQSTIPGMEFEFVDYTFLGVPIDSSVPGFSKFFGMACGILFLLFSVAAVLAYKPGDELKMKPTPFVILAFPVTIFWIHAVHVFWELPDSETELSHLVETAGIAIFVILTVLWIIFLVGSVGDANKTAAKSKSAED